MKLLKYVMPAVAAVAFMSSAAFAEHCDTGDHSHVEQDLNEKDWSALRNYINTKRTINVQEKACNLTIAGDVRVDWRNTNEKECGARVRGREATEDGLRVGRNDFDVEFNLYFDYYCDRGWAVAQLQFDNSAGVQNNWPCIEDEGLETENSHYQYAMHGSGVQCDVNLKKAYMGYNICCDGCTRFDVEVGRRPMYTIFDSEVQFLSRFDGILLKYDSCFECYGDWYVHLGGFVVDYRVNHYAFIVEAGLLNICDWGFDFKYSFIDWEKNGRNVCGARNPVGADFLISQFAFYYHFDPEMLCMPAKLFGAALWNHAADTFSSPINVYDKGNFAWYVGFQAGEVVYCGDWAFKAQYQWVEAQAVPDSDMSGIGNGNVGNNTYVATGKGNTNFKGWRVEALYAFTDNITFDLRYEWSTEIKANIAVGSGTHDYSQFKLEAIYAF